MALPGRLNDLTARKGRPGRLANALPRGEAMRVRSSISRMRPALLLCTGVLLSMGPLEAAMRVSPPAVVLETPEASEQLLVFDAQADGRSVDLTRAVTYEVAAPAVVRIDPAGMVFPL